MIKYILIFALVASINLQLTLNDKEFIISFILKAQNIKTGLFNFNTGNDIKATREAIEVLNILKKDVYFSREICQQIKGKEINYDISVINSLLNCSVSYSKEEKFNSNKIIDLYRILMTKKNFGDTNDLESYYETLNSFLSSKIFSLNNREIKKTRSLFATALGLEMLNFIAEKDEKLKGDISSTVSDVVNVLLNSNYNEELSENMILFTEKKLSNYRLNYHMIKALKESKKLGVTIKNFPEILYKFTKYFQEFKYSIFNNIENLNYYIKSCALLDKIPLLLLDTTSYNYIKKSKIALNFLNIFGEKLTQKNSSAFLTVKKTRGTNENRYVSRRETKDSYDLNDDEESAGGKKGGEKLVDFMGKNSYEMDLGDMINEAGDFELSVRYNNDNFDLKEVEKFTIKSYSDIIKEKIEISLEIEDKIFEEKTIKYKKITYPNKYTNPFKATQDHALKIILTVPNEDAKLPTFHEQTFLRLTHKDLNKSFDAYSSHFFPESNEYRIVFSLDDPVNMESYNGEYELSVVVSFAGNKQPFVWKFGAIRISFTKPSDPRESDVPLKNKLLPKMEPTFPPEIDRNKHKNLGMFFSFLILAASCFCLVIAQKIGANLKGFPSFSFGGKFNILFVALLLTIVLILFLFWVKLNIVQTMKIYAALLLPATLIVYKAMKENNIKILGEKEEKLD